MRQIEIEGKKYPIRFTLKSLKEYERLTSRNLLKEDYREIFNLTLGVDCLTGFVFAGLVGALERGQTLDLTPDDLERVLGLDNGQYEGVVQAYIDFVPGLRKIYDRIVSDEDFAKKIQQANGDEEKLKAIYLQLLESPNGVSQAETV